MSTQQYTIRNIPSSVLLKADRIAAASQRSKNSVLVEALTKAFDIVESSSSQDWLKKYTDKLPRDNANQLLAALKDIRTISSKDY